MLNPFRVVLDRWSELSHKAPLGDTGVEEFKARALGWRPYTWAGEEHERRLTAYLILGAYDQNVARHFLEGSDDDRKNRREYGDAALLIETTMSAILGDEQTVVVPGSEEWSQARYDELLDEQDELSSTRGQEDVDPESEDEETRARRLTEVGEEIAALEDARTLAELQEFLQEWADDVHFTLRMVDCERQTVGLGDGVYLLGWDAGKERPTIAVMDPGSYFPVLPDSLDAYEYPRRVHFAWEIPGEGYPDGKTRVRRITYELGPIRMQVDEDALAQARTDEEIDAAYTLPEGAVIVEQDVTGPDGTVVQIPTLMRQYPWREEGDLSDETCLLTDATWVLDDVEETIEAFALSNAEVLAAYEADLGIDFLPVVHVPNTPCGGDHFGISSLSKVLQIVDDLQNADTDAEASSATTGNPMLALSGDATRNADDPLLGTRGEPTHTKPGAVFRLGSNGRADVIDTSAMLTATREYVKHLRDRLSTNARLPGSILGTVEPQEVSSGYHMQLTFGPLHSMVRTHRLVRSVKYPLLLKMVLRLYQANAPEIVPAGPTPRAEVKFGSYLPADMAGTLELVQKALEAKAISLETAVKMLLEVGFPIDDVAEEIARIMSRDYEGAAQLVNALNDRGLGYEHLGLEAPPESESAEVVQVDPETGEPLITPPRNQPVAGGTGTGVPSPTDSGGA